MRTLRVSLLLSLLAVCGNASTLSYIDTTAGGPIFNRPIAGTPPNSLSGVGTAVPYNVLAFIVDQAGTYTIQSTATNPANWDNYTFLYATAFDPANPLVNALTGNDDNPTIGLSGFSFGLNVGTTYFLVTTGFGNSNAGIFSNSIDGPGTPSSVPEPSTLLTLASALAAIAAWRRSNA
jgi:hypothetical protein